MGKNHFLYFYVLLSILVVTSSADAVEECSASYNVNQLDYAGVKVSDNFSAARCVDVTSSGAWGEYWDGVKSGGWIGKVAGVKKGTSTQTAFERSSAEAYCMKKTGMKFPVSYGDPKFSDGSQENFRWTCFKETEESVRRQLCNVADGGGSAFKKQIKVEGVKIRFEFADNICKCWLNQNDLDKRDCSRSFPFNAQEVAGAKPTGPAAPTTPSATTGEKKTCEKFNPALVSAPSGTVPEDAENPCHCKGLVETDVTWVAMRQDGVDLCKDLLAQQNGGTTPSAASVVLATEPTKALVDCIAVGRGDLKQCTDSEKSALKECVESSADNAQTKALANAGKKAYISNKVGSGAQQECFAASAAANVGSQAFEAANGKCTSSITTCASKCSNVVYENIEKTCREKIGTSPSTQPINQQYFDAQTAEIKKGLNDSLVKCTDPESEVDKGKKMISGVLESLGIALRDSLTCMCMLGNTNPSDKEKCKDIVKPSDCAANPSATGCAGYAGVNVCSPGSGYDATLCSCQTNPKSAGCPGGGLSGNLVGFATGANINNGGGSNDAGFGNPGSNLKASGDVDLSGINGGPTAAGNLKLEDTKAGGSPGGGPGGGGGGGGGGGDGGGDPDATAANEDEKSGLNGLFNQAKSFMSSSLGMGSKKDNGNLKNGQDKNKRPNMDAFRPRGMASSDSGLGSKNMDIWKMMNMCTNGERCKSNVNNYIMGP